MKKLIAFLALALAGIITRADVRLPEYGQVAAISNTVDTIAADYARRTDIPAAPVIPTDYAKEATLTNAAAGIIAALPADYATAANLALASDKIDVITAAIGSTGLANLCLVDVSLNPDGATFELPTDSTERAEILSNACIAVTVPGVVDAIKIPLPALSGVTKRVMVPFPAGRESRSATISLELGESATCAYHATPATISLESGAIRTATLLTVQMSGANIVTELARIQPYTSTASDSGDSWLARKVTGPTGTRFHVGYYDANNTFVKDAGVRVDVYTVPTNAASVADCEVAQAYGSASDQDIFELLNVLGQEKLVDVIYTGDSVAITNKFVRFSPVYVKTTYEDVQIPVHDGNGNTISTRSIPSVIRWFSNTQADSGYHLHSAFVRYERSGDTFTETPVPYTYIARYPISNASITCGGVSYSIAKSQSDLSQEVGNTRAGFLDRCRNVNNATITIVDPATGDVLQTIAANSDSRAMSMVDVPAMSLVEDLAYLLFGVNAQSHLRGVSVDTADAKEEQKNGKSDYIAALGIKLGGRAPTSAYYNFNFLDIEGGTWSAPGCMFVGWTSVMERTTVTDAEGVPTSTTQNRYIFSLDRLDHNPGSSDVDNLLANGCRWVSFKVGSNKRIGMDDSLGMRDAKLYCADQTVKNVNYAAVDAHWQGSAPSAIANYSATATYNENAYAIYDGKLYQCVTPVTTAEAFDSEKWSLQTSKTIIARSCFMVARGLARHNGASLGPLSLNANNGLAHSNGNSWRSRLSLQPLPAAE